MTRRVGGLVRCVLLGAGAGAGAGGVLACPIARPPIPPEYYDFRADLQTAVTDTAVVIMAGDLEMQNVLESQLSRLAAYLTVDALLDGMTADEPLRRLAEAVLTKTRSLVSSDDTGGSVREAFANADGQRLAVDAIVAGLGRAVYKVRSS